MNKAVSPSRTYVAICSNHGFKGYHFKKFSLPEDLPNDTDTASWYFLNQISFEECIDGCVIFEDYSNIKNVSKEDMFSQETPSPEV